MFLEKHNFYCILWRCSASDY